eukprot:c39531_g1_i1.p2 GENE.c39531_g1_i1~~c39531_g1_i1.p2  ORF type:complete len:282 (+),score=67.34 c39531_g1_i1:33-878(+)
MKSICVVIAVLLACGMFATAMPIAEGLKRAERALAQKHETVAAPDADLCPICLDLISDSINELLQAILQVGVLGGCSGICSKLSHPTEQVACTLICSYVGVDAFVAIIDKIDPDPIEICEDFKVCPIHDNGEANITSIDVSPETVEIGGTVDITVNFDVINTTGTGMIAVEILPAGAGFPIEGAVINEGYPPGSYQEQFQLKLEPTSSDPMEPGRYRGVVAYCNGQCGADHPNTRTLTKMHFEFDVVDHSTSGDSGSTSASSSASFSSSSTTSAVQKPKRK